MAEPQIIENRFRVIKTLGVGGMGKVLLCQDTVLKRTVALKLLSNMSDPVVIKRFHEEAKSAAQLNHPNIIEVLNLGVTDSEDLFIVMEYLEGKSLDKMLKEKGKFELDEAIFILQQICEGLLHAHNNGVVHRDIKPSNIMISESETGVVSVKIVDFGIAKRVEANQELTTTGSVIGTPAYISPESARSEKVDHRTDVYSFGCMMFEILTGEKPFQASSSFETIYLHLNEAAPTLFEKSDIEFPEHLERVVAKCLSKNADDRYQSMQSLLDDLTLIMDPPENEQHDEQNEILEEKKNSIRYPISCILIVLVIGIIGVSIVATTKQPVRTKPEKEKTLAEIGSYENLKSSAKLRNLSKEPGTYRVQPFIDTKYLPKLVEEVKRKKISTLILDNQNLIGPDCAVLKDLAVEDFILDRSKLDGKALSYIGQVKNLRELRMDETIGSYVDNPVGFSNMRTVFYLDLRDTDVKDTIIEPLSHCPELKILELRNCKEITGKGLSKLTNLSSLNISGTGFDHACLDEITSLKKLVKLDISRLEITDEDLRKILNMKLVYLDLGENNFLSREAIFSLSKMKTLKELSLDECKNAPREVIKELSLKMPQCMINGKGFAYLNGKRER